MVTAVATVAGAAAGGWLAFARLQGDSRLVFEPEALVGVHGDGQFIYGETTIVNRGKVGGVVHKVEGRLVGPGRPAGRVYVTRKGRRPPEPGWWESNCLLPGESCVAEVAIELEAPATRPVTVEVDVHEIGRRLKVHRVARLVVPVPVVERGRAEVPPATPVDLR